MMRNRLVSIGIVYLLVIGGFVGFIPFESDVVNATTHYVGGSGGGNYSSIQEAIDNANDWDTVFVYNGTYFENVVVNKSIALIGEDKNITRIDGGGIGDVINVSADFVNISGFTIMNSGSIEGDSGIEIYSYTDTFIIGNNISSNWDGIRLLSDDNSRIIGNNISSNFNMGIYLNSSLNTNITGNNISSNTEGVSLTSSSNNNVIGNNVLDNSGGIYISSTSYTNIIGNNVLDNICGIYIVSTSYINIIGNNISDNFDSIYIDSASYTNITNNNISNNDVSGIYIVSSDYNNIIGNNISNNPIIYGGIYLVSSNNNNIIGNNISNSSSDYRGISLDSSSYNNITSNIVSDNERGIVLDYSSYNNITGNNVSISWSGIELHTSFNNTIIANDLFSNIDSGIYLDINSDNNTIYHNNFIDNVNSQASDYGNNCWNDTYPSGGNYWSDYTGIDLYSTPTQDVPPPDGIGDTPYIIDANSQDNYPFMTNNSWEFTTEDVIEPEISSTSPANGTIDVLITADIVITFSEEMNTSLVTYICTPDPGGWSVIWSAGNTTATYSHNDFSITTTYTFNITAAKDVAGNDLVAGAVPNPWTFTTEDVIAPQISSTTPANETIDVPINADVIVNFTEEMNTSTVTYTCTPDPGGWTVVWSAGNTTATYSHNNFASETTYTFEITGGKDLAGNDLVAGAVPNPWEFTTEDGIPNTLPIVSFIETPIGVQTGNVTIQYKIFDPDPGDDGSMSVEVFFSTDNMSWYPATQGGGDPLTGLNNNTLYSFIWDSADPLDLPDTYNTTVYIKIVPYDGAGQGTSNQTGPFTVDNKAPVLLSGPTVTPTNTTALIEWTVDEPANATVWYGLTPNPTDETSNSSGTTLQSVLLTNLMPGSNYTFCINSTDSGGNKYTSYPTDFTFETLTDVTLDRIIISLTPDCSTGWIGDQFYGLFDTDTFYACGWNDTYNEFVILVEADWLSNDTGVGDVNPITGTSTTFDALGVGICHVTATNASHGSNDTGKLTVMDPTIDYVQIRTQDNGGGLDLCDPANYPSYQKGTILTFYGAAYNYSAPGDGYIGDVNTSSTWDSTNFSIVDVILIGSSSTITCSNSNWGTVSVTLNDNGITNTTQVTVLAATVDYISIVNTAEAGEFEIDNDIIDLGVTIRGYAAAFNFTSGYLGDVSVNWSVWNSSGANASTGPLTGNFSDFYSGLIEGTTYWNASWFGGSFYCNDTVVFTIKDLTSPVADAGFDDTVNEDTPYMFDGSGSWDNSGSIAWYNWTFGDGNIDHGTNTTPFNTYTEPGIYIVNLNVSDAAGNWNINIIYITVYDATPPDTVLSVGGPKYREKPSHGWNVTSITPFTLSAVDYYSGVNFTWYTIDGDYYVYTGPFDFNGYSDGMHTLTYGSEDNLENNHTGTQLTVKVDDSPPVTNLEIEEPKYRNNPMDTWNITSYTNLTLTADDNLGSGVASMEYKVHNVTYDSGWLSYSENFILESLALNDGLYTLEWRSADHLGNTESGNVINIFLDSIPPDIQLLSPLNNSVIPAGTILDFQISDDNLMAVNYSVNGGANLVLSPPFDISTTGWADDNYIIQINAGDWAGNWNSATITITVSDKNGSDVPPSDNNVFFLILAIIAISIIIIVILMIIKSKRDEEKAHKKIESELSELESEIDKMKEKDIKTDELEKTLEEMKSKLEGGND